MRASDALLVSLRSPGLEGAVPSKFYDCCAVGRPVVMAATGEALTIGEEAGAVIGVAPGDPAELARAIQTLRDDKALRERLSARGRALAAECDRDRGVEIMERVLRDVSRGAA